MSGRALPPDGGLPTPKRKFSETLSAHQVIFDHFFGLNKGEGEKNMNENLIPQVVIDLGNKYLVTEDSNEHHNLEMRINDTIEYLESIRRVKRASGFKRNTPDRAADIQNYIARNGTARTR